MAKFSGNFGVTDMIPAPKAKTTHTHDYTHDDTQEIKRKRKNRRVQILTYDDIVDRLDRYCKKNDISRAEVFEKVINQFLAENGE